jgi:hypothetical protein
MFSNGSEAIIPVIARSEATKQPSGLVPKLDCFAPLALT